MEDPHDVLLQGNPDVLLWVKLIAWAMSDEESDGENGRTFKTLP